MNSMVRTELYADGPFAFMVGLDEGLDHRLYRLRKAESMQSMIGRYHRYLTIPNGAFSRVHCD